MSLSLSYSLKGLVGVWILILIFLNGISFPPLSFLSFDLGLAYVLTDIGPSLFSANLAPELRSCNPYVRVIRPCCAYGSGWKLVRYCRQVLRGLNTA